MSLTLSPRRPVIPRARPSLLLEPVVTPSPLKQAKVSQAPQEPVTAAKSTCVLSALSPEPVWAPPPPSRSIAVATPTASSSQQKDKAAYKSWSGRWIGMEGPLRELLALCGRPEDRVPPVVVYGAPGTGKTGMVTDVLSHLGVPVVFVFCPVLLSTKKLYEVVLTALEARIKGNPASSTAHGAGDSSDDDDHATVRVNHDRFSEFVARVKALWRSPETLYLVFDSADRLGTLHPRLVRNLVMLSSLAGVNVTPVFTVNSPNTLLHGWDDWADLPPVMLRCPNLSQDALLQVLARSFGDKPTLKSFWTTVWGVCGGICGPNLREMTYLTNILWPVYETHGGSSAVFRSSLSACCESMFSHDLLSSAAKGVSVPSRGVELELPYLSKFLLLAAYCASHNPPDTDLRYFTRAAGKGVKGRRAGGAVKRKRAGGDLAFCEPKTFPLERLLAIFNSLLAANDGVVSPAEVVSADMLSEVTSLVSLQLLSRESGPGDLEGARFKCCVGSQTVFAVAKRVRVNLAAVLHEPELHPQ